MNKYTEKEIGLMRLALGLSGLPVSDAVAETVMHVSDSMRDLGDQFSVKDAVEIEFHILNKYHRNKIKVTATKKRKS